MLIKYTVITTKSLVIVRPTITKYDGSFKSFLASKNLNVRPTLKSGSFPIHQLGEIKNSYELSAGRNFFFAISFSKKI